MRTHDRIDHFLRPLGALLKIALVAVSKNELLMKCSQTSILQSVMTAAQLGLDCGGALGSAYLVPFYDNKKGGGQPVESRREPGFSAISTDAFKADVVGKDDDKIRRAGNCGLQGQRAEHHERDPIHCGGSVVRKRAVSSAVGMAVEVPARVTSSEA